MVIDISRNKKFTLESAYYECVLECHDAISNGMISALTESAGFEVLNEGFKDTFKNIVKTIVTALRNLKNKIVKKFNEIKAKIKGNKKVADKVDEATKKVEDTFDKEREKMEKIDIDRPDIDKVKIDIQNTADTAVNNIKKSAESSSRDISKFIKSLKKKADNIKTLDDYKEVGQSIIDMAGDDADAFAESLSKDDQKEFLDALDKFQAKKDDAIAGSIISIMKDKMSNNKK